MTTRRRRKKPKVIHPLSHAREVALQGLYQIEIGAQNLDTILRFPWLNQALDAQKQEFARHLILQLNENEGTLDVAIHVHSHKHRTQISNIIRCLLRMALFELQSEDTPVAVAINEYIVLARKYDGEESVPFVNAVLDSYCKQAGLDTGELDLSSDSDQLSTDAGIDPEMDVETLNTLLNDNIAEEPTSGGSDE